MLLEFFGKYKAFFSSCIIALPLIWYLFYDFVPRDAFIGISLIGVGFLYFCLKYSIAKKDHDEAEAKLDELQLELREMKNMNEQQIKNKLKEIDTWYLNRRYRKIINDYKIP